MNKSLNDLSTSRLRKMRAAIDKILEARDYGREHTGDKPKARSDEELRKRNLKFISVPLYPCPNGHYVPAATGAPSRFAWHDIAGVLAGRFSETRCEFSGAYVPMPEDEVKKMAEGQ